MTRERKNLAGTWEIVRDAEAIGKKKDWHLWPTEVKESAEKILVPSLWNEKWPDYVGVVFYHCLFEGPLHWRNKRVNLHFEGVNYFAEVWLNGEYLGSHEGGYAGFSCCINPALSWTDKNDLVVRIIDPPREDGIEGMKLAEIPCAKESWYYQIGGIYGDVYLEATSQTYLENVYVAPQAACSTVDVSVIIKGKDVVGCVECEILDSSGVRTSYSSEEIRTTAAEPVSMRLRIPNYAAWTPELPYLYEVHCRLVSEGQLLDEQRQRFGMREFRMEKGRFYLNGESFIIKGVLLQPDYPVTSVMLDKELVYKELKMFKEAGINLVRVHVRPAPPFFLDLADEMGILVYQETALGFLAMSDHARRRCENEIREMILRDRNHPSVVMWGILNESQEIPPDMRLELLAYSLEFDKSRPIIDDSGMSLSIAGGTISWVNETHASGPGIDVTEPIQDVHLYPWCPLDMKTFNWLSEMGDVDGMRRNEILLDNKGLRNEWYQKVQQAVEDDQTAVFVSEYGGGGFSKSHIPRRAKVWRNGGCVGTKINR